MRRRTFRSKRRKTPMFWYGPSGFYRTPINLNDTASPGGWTPLKISYSTVGGILAREGIQDSLGAAVQPGYPNRITIRNIRGQVGIASAFNTDNPFHGRITWSMGIVITEIQSDGTFGLYDPADPATTEKSWMWLHHDVTGPQASGAAFGGFGTFNNTDDTIKMIDVNIKTRRVLQRNEVLEFFIAAQPEFNSAGVLLPFASFRPNLRLLLSRGI